MSRKPSEEANELTFYEVIYKAIRGMIVNEEEPRRTTRTIKGTHDFEFRDWRYWGDSSDWLRIAFFKWRVSITQSNTTQYSCKFNLTFNSSITYCAREAAAEGITFEDFVTTALAIAHTSSSWQPRIACKNERRSFE